MIVNKILVGDALSKLKELPKESIDCVMTSPPYWALRDYGVEGQLGLEPTFDEFINKLCDIFDEVKRVIKPSGTCWVNLGDTYSNNTSAGNMVMGNPEFNKNRPCRENTKIPAKKSLLQNKCLCGIPFRFAQAMIDGIYKGRVIKNEIDSAWLAGIVDGEGTIGIYWSHGYFGLRLQVPNKDILMLQKIIDITNFGKIWDRGDGVCYWKCQGKIASDIICDIYPFLVTKKKQALIGWNFYLLQEDKSMELEEGKKYGNENGRPKMANVLREKRKKLSEVIHSLNQRESIDLSKLNLKEVPKSKVGGGWVLRNVIIWHKPNCMPSSVKDRFTVDFEYLFFFVKSKKYYFEQQREPVLEKSLQRSKYGLNQTDNSQKAVNVQDLEKMGDRFVNPDGRNVRCVWKICPQPFSASHFAVFPEELCEMPIKSGCPEGGIVLDPFFGSGTIAVVAKKLKRNWLGIELNPDYVLLAERRLKGVTDWQLMKDIDEGKQKILK